jgi:CO/xanthine dehydrogenase FAD-binding subunit
LAPSATYTDVIGSPLVARHLPMLVEAARLVGGPQIQNRGTIGGNCRQCVAGLAIRFRSLPPRTRRWSFAALAEERRVAFREFYTGYRATVMRPEELIVSIEVPQIDGHTVVPKSRARGPRRRSPRSLSRRFEAMSRESRFGSVGPTVVRAWEAERMLASGASIDDAADALSEDIAPIDDIRSTADYRQRVATNLLRRFWSETARV